MNEATRKLQPWMASSLQSRLQTPFHLASKPGPHKKNPLSGLKQWKSAHNKPGTRQHKATQQKKNAVDMKGSRGKTQRRQAVGGSREPRGSWELEDGSTILTQWWDKALKEQPLEEDKSSLTNYLAAVPRENPSKDREDYPERERARGARNLIWPTFWCIKFSRRG